MVAKEVEEVKELKDRKNADRPVKNDKDLLVYQQALLTSRLTKSLPRDEQARLPSASSGLNWRLLRDSFRKVRRILKAFGKLGFMIHNLWKEWRKL